VKAILKGLRSYLTDWRNLLMHAAIGVGLVLVAVYLPVPPVVRVGIFAAVIAFNVIRMRREKGSGESLTTDAIEQASEA
jgi:hypothetical protein